MAVQPGPWTEDDAERVADRVGKDSEAGLTLTGCTGGTKGEQFLLGLIGISHANVEMQLPDQASAAEPIR